MKILAVSDEVADGIYSPALKQKFGGVDLVLGCGDLPFFYLEYIVNALDVPVFYVPGNHDQREQYLNDGRTVHQAEGCQPIDGQTAVAFDHTPRRLLLAGLGGSLRYNDNDLHQYTQLQMFQRAYGLALRLLINRMRYGRYLDILITHAPPRGIHDRPTQAHTGIDAFLWLMNVFKPRYLLHGHTHRYRQDVPAVTRFRVTDVVNVYPYRVVDWEAADA
jgi:Icc-related predicted phosphoesterase